MIDLSLTIPQLFLRAWKEHPHATALWIKHEHGFTSLTWQELAEHVAGHMLLLQQNGCHAGERVVQISGNRLEWIAFDLACHFLGVVHVPLHATLGTEAIQEQIADCTPRLIVVSTAIIAVRLSPTITATIPCFSYEESSLPRWMPLLPANPESVLQSQTTAEQLTTILYTSGTTQKARGVMLTQRNLAFNAQAVAEAAGEKSVLKFNLLPLSHVFARTCDLYVWLVQGTQLSIGSTRVSFVDDMQQLQPTHFNAVPYVFERLRQALVARNVAHVPGALRQLMGGNIQSCSSGGAPLAVETLRYYQSQQVPLLEGYGLTEASPVITMTNKNQVLETSCGQALPGVAIKLAENGELLTSGPHVMAGYWHDSIATNAVLQNGWLHTGDIAELNSDGHCFIKGRLKEIIVTSNGKKIVPTVIEQRFTHDAWIAQLIIVGEGMPYIAALVVLHERAVLEWAKQHNFERLSFEDILQLPDLQITIHEHLRQQQTHITPHERIEKFVLLKEAFSLDRGELTQKLSLCRPVISQNYQQEISGIYKNK
jgi:long-chain acyl-CoA synthetase